MDLELKRKVFTDVSTIGELYVDGNFECYTLEDVVRNPGIKVPGETAIPYGTYKVEITFSPRFKKHLPELLDVPNFTGVRIHCGNTAKDTEGCILVGDGESVNFISQSHDAYEELIAKLTKADDITIRITKV
jgi:hypothetical protein